MQLELERVMKNVSRESDAVDASDGDDDDHPPLDSDSGSDSDSETGSGSGVPGVPSAAAEEAALVERAKQAAGCWQVTTTTVSPPDQAAAAVGDTSVPLRDALALREVRVMKSYRPRLFREGIASAKIRREVIRVLCRGRNGRGSEMMDIFWDKINLL